MKAIEIKFGDLSFATNLYDNAHLLYCMKMVWNIFILIFYHAVGNKAEKINK